MSDDFLLEIQDSFLVEAVENLAQSESLFMALEKPDANHQDIFGQLKRLAHNFKGSGKAVGFDDLSAFSHAFENLLIALSQSSIQLTGGVVDLLLRCNDALKNDLGILQGDKAAKLDHSDLMSEIESAIAGGLSGSSAAEHAPQSSEPVSAPARAPSEVVSHDIHADAEDSVAHADVVQHTDPASIAKPNMRMVKPALPPATTTAVKDEHIRIPMKRIEDLFNSFGEQVIFMSALDHLKENFAQNKDELDRTIFNLKKITYELQQSTLSLRMVNLKGLYAKLERAIRDVSRMTQKPVYCDFAGVEQELDKAIVDQISDALTHMVRNSVDHGLETPADRIIAGKKEEGVVGIRAFREAGNFVIEIFDDGKGLDPDRIRQKGIEKGLIRPDTNLSEKEIFELIFENGFSTKDVASEISGRGVGMNVVKEVIQSLNGTYEIFSKVGKGTKFRMKLPLSLSLFNGMCFVNQGQRYVVPSSQVLEIMNTDGLHFRDTEKNMQVVQIRDDVNRIVDLRKILVSKNAKVDDKTRLRDMVMISNIDGEKACFRIEQVTGIVRVVQKPISPEMSTCPGSVGVTILGDGNPALILDLRVLWSDLKMSKAA